MDANITLQINVKLKMDRSSHFGHKTEFQITDENHHYLRLGFNSEDTLDKFYESFTDFYQKCKNFYKERKESGLDKK